MSDSDAPESKCRCRRINPHIIRCCKETIYKWFAVWLVVGTLSWSYYAFLAHGIIGTMTGSLQILAFILVHIILPLFIWAYYKSITTPPMEVPDKFRLDADCMHVLALTPTREKAVLSLRTLVKIGKIPHEVLDMAVMDIRYCRRCCIVKPDRCHHCSICRSCVVKMDHHCHWLANCVGFTNYKFFLLFVTYGLMYCLLIISTTFPFIIISCKGNWTGLASTYNQTMAVFVVAWIFVILQGPLWGFHVSLIARNSTTLETVRVPAFAYGNDKRGFDLGLGQNFRQVFGDNCILWPFPIFTSKGDGVRFPTRCDPTGQVLPQIPVVTTFRQTTVINVSSCARSNATTSSMSSMDCCPCKKANHYDDEELPIETIYKNSAIKFGRDPVSIATVTLENDRTDQQSTGDTEASGLTGIRVEGSRLNQN